MTYVIRITGSSKSDHGLKPFWSNSDKNGPAKFKTHEEAQHTATCWSNMYPHLKYTVVPVKPPLPVMPR